jgi:hypothetical protein
MKIEKVSSEKFWPLFKPLRNKLFEDTLFYDARDIRTPHEQRLFERLRKGVGDA